MMVSAIKCYECKDIVYSRARHDMISCSCGKVAIDGGRDYMKISYHPDSKYKTKTIRIPYTQKELYDDWNNNRDKLGHIKRRKF